MTLNTTTPSNLSTSYPTSNASISVRDYIYVLPHPLPEGTPVPYTPGLPERNPLNYPTQTSEPTSTLVLTSPARTFVDVRVLKGPGEELLSEGDPQDRLEWAFAGRSESEVVRDPFDVATGGSYPHSSDTRTFAGAITHASWTHWVDSRHTVSTPTSKIPKDDGVMFPLSSTQTLEHGSSTNPVTGESHAYEESWTDLPILSTSPSGGKACIVLRLDATEDGLRGVVIRLGGWCQGLLMEGKDVTVERWELLGDGGGGEWKRRVRIGDGILPCEVAWKEGEVIIGGAVKCSDYTWEVEEVVQWMDL